MVITNRKSHGIEHVIYAMLAFVEYHYCNSKLDLLSSAQYFL